MKTFSQTFADAQTGSERAQARLYRKYASRVFGAVRRRLTRDLRRKFDSTDIVQSVFAEVVRDLPRLENRGEDAFCHWLYIKTENKVRSKQRKTLGRDARRKEAHLVVDVECQDDSPPGTVERQETSILMSEAIDELDHDARLIVRLRLGDGLPFREVARQMQLSSPEAARKRYARAINRLREHLVRQDS